MTVAIKGRIWQVLYNALSLWNRFRVYVGLLNVKYGILGHFEYKGLYCTKMAHVTKRIDACEHYDNFRPDDVILMTYPKTGTHFTGEVILSIYKEKEMIKPHQILETSSGPFEAALPQLAFRNSKKGKGTHPLSDLDDMPNPRIFSTHLPLNLLPPAAREGGVKVIHCFRNPKDTVCSFYPFLRKMGLLTPETSWKEFVEYFINGTVLYGGYLQWLKQWYPYRKNSNVLNLQFEDMKKDLRGNVKKIAGFLNIELTPEQVDNVVAANSFEKKKKEAGMTANIYRKGKSGGWKSDITVEQNEMLDEWIKEETKDMPDLQFQCM